MQHRRLCNFLFGKNFNISSRLRGQREISVVCDDGRFISPKEYSTSGEQGRRGLFSRTLNATFLYSLSFFPLMFVANLLADIFIPTFCRPKSSKKAQHRQNQSLSSLLRNFASKISFVRRSFAGNFPLKDTGVSNLATLCVSENLPLFSVSFCSRCL